MILQFNVISINIKREPLETMNYLIMYRLLFGLNPMTERHNSPHSICHVQSQASMSRQDYFPLLTQLNWVNYYDLIQLVLYGDLSELSLIPYSLLLIIIYTPILFPPPPIGRLCKTISTIFQ